MVNVLATTEEAARAVESTYRQVFPTVFSRPAGANLVLLCLPYHFDYDYEKA